MMVQVKSVRQKGKQPPSYVFLVKKHFSLDAYRAVVLVVFPQDADHPELYLVPADAWRTPNAPFVDRDYEGRKSRPEYGISLSSRWREQLSPWIMHAQLPQLGEPLVCDESG